MGGVIAWTEYYDSPFIDEGRSVSLTADDGLVVTGSIEDADGDKDVLVLKYSSLGSLQWSAPLGGSERDAGYSIVAAQNGDFVVGGFSESFTPYRAMYLARLTAMGDFIWEATTFGPMGDWEGRGVCELQNGDLVCAGYTEAFGSGGRDFYMWHTDGSGGYIEGPTFGGIEDEVAFAITPTNDGGYLMAGSSMSFGPGLQAVYVVRNYGDPNIPPVVSLFDPVGITESHLANDPIQIPVIFPNSAAPGAFIRIAGSICDEVNISDLSGRVVSQTNTMHTPNGFELPKLTSGSYVVMMLVDGRMRGSARLMITSE
ncbi:MAG: hypothetical protein IPP33_08950 [Flavobacteriales bacterium]|nr:hypothetical protein [Flavobacteriales bacterium]